jgi:hypothetical protein
LSCTRRQEKINCAVFEDLLLYNTIEKVKEMVGSKIFSVEFIKLNGEHRKMVCRLGVKKHLRGGSLSYDAK